MVVAPGRLLRYAITDLASPLSDAAGDRALRLREQLRRWTVDQVDIVQLREKTLDAGDLLALARFAQATLEELAVKPGTAEAPGRPRLLVNGRVDVALAAGADGVHLPAHPGALTPAQVRELFNRAGRTDCLVSISCHTADEVEAARDAGADLILFGPIFEKRVGGEVAVEGKGLQALRHAALTAQPVPLLALGGVTADRIASCLRAGAAGVAGIRLFDHGMPQ